MAMSLSAGAGSALAGPPNPAGAAPDEGTIIWDAAPTSWATAAPIDQEADEDYFVPPDPESQPEAGAQLPGGNAEGPGGELPADETAQSDSGSTAQDDSRPGGSYAAAGQSASQASSSADQTLDPGNWSDQPAAINGSDYDASHVDADNRQAGNDRWQLMGIGLLLISISLGAVLTLVFFISRLNVRAPGVS